MKDIMGRDSARKSLSGESLDQNPMELAFSAFGDKCITTSLRSNHETSQVSEHDDNKGAGRVT